MGEKRGVILSAAFFLLLALLAIPCSLAIEYYADVEIALDADGTAAISGTTNHPLLLAGETNDLTSKKATYWLFNITIQQQFSDFIFKIVLPKEASINYVHTPSQIRIAEEAGRLTIIGTGKDEPFSIQVQYIIDKSLPEKASENLLIWFGIPLALIIIGGFLLLLARKRPAGPGMAASPKPSYNPDTLTERQNQILNIIQGTKGIVTQAMIERAIKIPKSSISRNIDSLVRKGILKKERRGMSNILTLAK